jgi:hypothetical protein
MFLQKFIKSNFKIIKKKNRRERERERERESVCVFVCLFCLFEALSFIEMIMGIKSFGFVEI